MYGHLKLFIATAKCHPKILYKFILLSKIHEIVFVLISDCLLLVYKNVIDSFILTCYPLTLLNSLIRSYTCFIDFPVFSR